MKSKKLSGLVVLFCSVILLMSSLVLPASAAKSISKAVISVSSSVSYTGKYVKPTVKVKLSGKTLSAKYYTVSYKNNKNIGKATVTVTGKNGYSGKVSKSFKIVPGKVKNVEAEADASSVTVSWNKVAGAQKYQVYMYSGGKWVRKCTTTALSYTVQNLKGATTYTFKVRSYKKVGSTYYIGAYSSKVKATTKLTAPTGISTTAAENSVTVKWSKVSGADYYQLWLYDYNNGWSLAKGTSSLKYTIKNLKSGTKYKIKLRAYTKDGDVRTYGVYSSATAFTTLIPAVEEMGADTVTTTGASIYWNPVSAADKYVVYVTEVETGEQILKETVIYPDITLKNLDPAQEYKITVKAYQASPKVYSAASTLTLVTAPSPAKDVNVSDIKENSAAFKWNGSSNCSGYEVRINELNSSGGVDNTQTVNVTGTDYTADSLKATTNYKVEIYSYVKIGTRISYSESPATVSFRTLPGKVTSLKATPRNTYISLSWDIQSGADGYLVLDSEGNTLKKLTGTQNIHTVTDLEEGKEYTFYVRTFCTDENGNTIYSEDAKVTASTISNKATAVKFTKKTSTLTPGETFQTAVSFEPADAIKPDVEYTSTYDDIAKIDSNGKITALKKGLTKITVTTADGKLKDSFTLSVEEIKSTAISVQSNITAYVGEYTKITPTFTPSNVSDKSFRISGTDHTYSYKVLFVSKTDTCKFSDYFYFDEATGRIRANKATIEPETGNKFAFTVTAIANDSGAKCTFKLSAEKRAIAITYEGDDNPWYYGNSAKLTAEVDTSAGFTKNQLVWKSSDTSVAKVSNNGNVECIGTGEVTITASSPDGKQSRSYTIYVREIIEVEKSYFENCIVGQSYQIKANVVPASSDAQLFYLSSNPNVAEVSKTGKVTIKSEGYSNIWISAGQADTVLAVLTTGNCKIPSGSQTELLSYMEKHANAVKTDMPRITRSSYSTFNNFSIVKESQHFSSAELVDFFESFAAPETKSIQAVNSSNYPSSSAYSEAASSYISSIPVAGQNFTILPGLEESDIKSVEVIDNGSYTYDVKLTLKNEYMSTPPTSPTRTAHGKVFDVLESKYLTVITDSLKNNPILNVNLEYTAFTQNYNNSSLTLTFNKVTGKLVNMNYDMNIHVEVIDLKLSMSRLTAIDSTVTFDVNNIVNIEVED